MPSDSRIRGSKPRAKKHSTGTLSSTAPSITRARNDPFFWVILLIAGLWIFWNLSGRCLWQDEAETALLGSSILRSGLPYASDGTYFVSQETCKEFGADFLWRWSPWIQFYLAAASMKLLGQTTLAPRLPFALLGLLAVALTYVLAQRTFRSAAIARLGALFLAASVPFLLHARQARWYAAGYVLCLCLFLSLAGMREGRRLAYLGFVAAAACLFYTNFLVAVGLLGAILVTSPISSLDRQFLFRLTLAYLAVLALSFPGLLFFNSFSEASHLSPAVMLGQLFRYGESFLTFMLPLPVLVLLAYLFVNKQARGYLEPASTRQVCFVLSISFVYLTYLSCGPWIYFRYLSVLLPLTSIVLGAAVHWVFQWNRFVGYAVLLLVVSTDVLHRIPIGYIDPVGTHSNVNEVVSLGPVGFPLASMIFEIANKIEDPEQAVSEYLLQNGKPGDVVLMSYGDLPVQYYTSLQVVGGFQGRPLPKEPDWIILRHDVLSFVPGRDGDVFKFVRANVPLSRYKPIFLRCKDFIRGNCPEPWAHHFKPPDGLESVLLFRRSR